MANESFDSFTETSDTTLTSHTSDSGHSWSLQTGSSGAATVTAATDDITSPSGVYCVLYTSYAPTPTEYDLKFDSVSVGAAGEVSFGLAARCDIGLVSSYTAFWRGGDLNWELRKSVNTVVTGLAWYAGDAPTTARSIVFQIRDATKKLFIDGTERASTTDNEITAAGRGGITCGNNLNTCRADGWSLSLLSVVSASLGKTSNSFHPGRSPGTAPVSARFARLPGAYTAYSATIYYQSISGGLTFTGSNIKTTLKTQAGALAFTGATVKNPAKVAAGSLTFAGSALKSTAKLLAGVLTFTGSLSALKSFVQAVGGTLSFASGTVSKATNKTVVGALTFAGGVVKHSSKVFAGALSFTGSTIKVASKVLAGTLTFVGALGAVLQSAYTYAQSVGGTLSFSSGTIAKIPSKILSGSISFSGAMLKATSKVLSGSLTFSGVALKQTYKIIGGALSFIGAVFIQAGSVAANLSRMVVAQARLRAIIADERMRKVISWMRVRFL